MARSCPPWGWTVLWRDHSPPDKSAIATMWMLRAFADETGSTFVGQDTIANRACLSRPTVRRGIEIAWRAQWVGVTHGRFVGKQWRHYEYRLCIPDDLHLSDEMQAIVDAHCALYGEVDTTTHPDIRKMARTSAVPRNAKRDQVGKQAPVTRVKKPAKVGKKDYLTVGKPFAPKSQSDQVPILSSNQHKHASSDACALSDSPTETKLEPEAAAPRPPRPTPQALQKPDDPLDARMERAAKLIETVPDIANAILERTYKLTAEQVLQIRTIQ